MAVPEEVKTIKSASLFSVEHLQTSRPRALKQRGTDLKLEWVFYDQYYLI